MENNVNISNRIGRKLNGYVVAKSDGTVLKSTFNSLLTSRYINLCQKYLEIARSAVRDLDPTDDLSTVRISTNSSEIMMIYAEEFIIVAEQLIKWIQY